MMVRWLFEGLREPQVRSAVPARSRATQVVMRSGFRVAGLWLDGDETAQRSPVRGKVHGGDCSVTSYRGKLSAAS